MFAYNCCPVNCCFDEMVFYWRTENMFCEKLDVKLGSSVARVLPGVNLAWKYCFLIGRSSRNG